MHRVMVDVVFVLLLVSARRLTCSKINHTFRRNVYRRKGLPGDPLGFLAAWGDILKCKPALVFDN
jgi:hypothetical protein